MVPVTKVLRQLQSIVDPTAPADRRLCLLIRDFHHGRCRLFHPSAPFINSFEDLPSYLAESLFVAEYNPATKSYEGTFHWFSKADLAQSISFTEHMNRYMALPGWAGRMADTAKLPLPKSETIGGLLVCRNGDGWFTIAIMPVDIEPAAALVHLVLALTRTLLDFVIQPEDEPMKATTHPMVEEARTKIVKIQNARRMIMLQSGLEAIGGRKLAMIDPAPGEEESFYDPENQLQISFLLAVNAFREHGREPVRYWIEWMAMEDFKATYANVTEHILMRFLRRRRATVPDQAMINLNGQPIPSDLIHAALLITRHPNDGLTTRLFVNRKIETPLGLALLEGAISQAFLNLTNGWQTR